MPPQRWGCGCGEVRLLAAGFRVIFAAIHMGFNNFYQYLLHFALFLLTGTWFLRYWIEQLLTSAWVLM
jgi:hypothetical protein